MCIRDRNLAHTGLAEQGKVVQGDYLAFLTGCREKFDLIFLDPPYGTGMLEKALEMIAKIDIVTEHGIIAVSYTHLDVYKRQICAWRRPGWTA